MFCPFIPIIAYNNTKSPFFASLTKFRSILSTSQADELCPWNMWEQQFFGFLKQKLKKCSMILYDRKRASSHEALWKMMVMLDPYGLENWEIMINDM